MTEEKTAVQRLEEEGDIAADYLEGLLDIADLDGDIEIGVENERASLVIEGGDLAHLVGRDGEVLDAIQELTRLAVQPQPESAPASCSISMATAKIRRAPWPSSPKRPPKRLNQAGSQSNSPP